MKSQEPVKNKTSIYSNFSVIESKEALDLPADSPTITFMFLG